MASSTLRTIDDALVATVVARAVDACAPEMVIVFGSAARGETAPGSDLDLLVVLDLPEGITARDMARKLPPCLTAGCFRSTSSSFPGRSGSMACGFQATLPARRSVKACGFMADALH